MLTYICVVIVALERVASKPLLHWLGLASAEAFLGVGVEVRGSRTGWGKGVPMGRVTQGGVWRLDAGIRPHPNHLSLGYTALIWANAARSDLRLLNSRCGSK